MPMKLFADVSFTLTVLLQHFCSHTLDEWNGQNEWNALRKRREQLWALMSGRRGLMRLMRERRATRICKKLLWRILDIYLMSCQQFLRLRLFTHTRVRLFQEYTKPLLHDCLTSVSLPFWLECGGKKKK